MIEKIIIRHLKSALNVAPYMEYPETPPGNFVVVKKTGGGESNKVYSATVAVQSIATTLVGAAELNEQVKSAMSTLANDPQVGSVSLNSDYNFTDPATKRYRYQAVFDIKHY